MQAKLKSPSSAKSARRQQLQQNNFSPRKLLIIIEVIALVVAGSLLLKSYIAKHQTPDRQIQSKFEQVLKNVPTPSPSPSPSPRPLTFDEMNQLYGPCVKLPVLMYHRVQTRESAEANKQASISVFTDVFNSQMQYLKSRNYNVLGMSDLVNFFDSATPIPGRSVLLTFDDAYQDYYTDAYPILSGLGFKSTVFVPTGLVENPNYLTWGEISGMRGLTLFANHTWSHKSVLTKVDVMQKEVLTADTQLTDHGLNNPKIFAYPYGPDNGASENYLQSLGYKAAFTTKPGSILCKRQRLDLPRVRVGNSPLSSYGL